MELKEFQGLALRTESRIDGIGLNRANLVTLLKIVVAVSEILDGIKKAAFYNKTAKLEGNFGPLLDTIEHLAHDLYLENEFNGTVNAVLDPNESIPNIDPRVFHGILGIITESGELAAALLKSVADPKHPIDAVNIQEEMSDIAWYKAILHDTLGLDWNQGLANVIEKLRIRYPEKYSDYNADNRNLDAERAALEVGVTDGGNSRDVAVDMKNALVEKIYNPLSRFEDFFFSTYAPVETDTGTYRNADQPIPFGDSAIPIKSSHTTSDEVKTLLGITLEETCACGKNPACECKEN